MARQRNVDGQFQKAGFDSATIVECHGSIHHLQCLRDCPLDIWPADALAVEVDVETCELRPALPRCPNRLPPPSPTAELDAASRAPARPHKPPHPATQFVASPRKM